jgi:hypothetical protein
MSIDGAIPADRKETKKEPELVSKYKELIRDIQCMWNVKANVISIITGET